MLESMLICSNTLLKSLHMSPYSNNDVMIMPARPRVCSQTILITELYNIWRPCSYLSSDKKVSAKTWRIITPFP